MRYNYQVYVYSDDIIVVEGDEDHEFYCYDTKQIQVGDTILEVTYTVDGVWEIEVEYLGSRDYVGRYSHHHPSDMYNGYTEWVFVSSDLKRVAEK